MARRLLAEKLMGFFKLTRPYILLTTTLLFIGSAFLSTKAIPPVETFVAGFLSVCCAIAAAHTVNDFFDWTVDSRNPRTNKRPIPSGLISPREALLFAIVLGGVALGIAFLLNLPSTFIALISVPLPFVYNWLRKHELPFSFLCPVLAEQNIILFGSASVTGEIAISNLWLLLLLSLFWETGRTINSEIQDVPSDTTSKITTIPVKLTPQVAAKLVFTLFSFASLLSVMLGVIANLGILYLTVSILSGIWLTYSGIQLVHEPTTQQAIKTRINAPKFITTISVIIAISVIFKNYFGF